MNTWNAAREAVAKCLEAKKSAPLERLTLSKSALKAISNYEIHRAEIEEINKTLTSSNIEIRNVKSRASFSNPDEVAQKLSLLKATKERHSPTTAKLCIEYLKEKKKKETSDTARMKARESLEKYRIGVFPRLQNGVNKYLARFNAGFRLSSFAPTNIRGGSACTYNIVINEKEVAVAGRKPSSNEPSFRNTLSSGDRNTLALALFFSSLDREPTLGNTIVVIDDPISSLDDHRSVNTMQEVRDLATRANQVIAMSHSKRFLCDIWRHADHKKCVSFEIAQKGDESTIREWDVSEDAITEHDQRHILLKEYAATQSGNIREVAKAIRLHLEGYLRVTCPGNFPPGKMLGPFIVECRQKLGNHDEVLDQHTTQELQELKDYGNQFLHVSNQSGTTVHINATELLDFVKRTLDFCGPRNP